jgi:diguanylate cyclase (GGDEF)-like protein
MAELTRLQAEISELRQLIRTDPLTGLSNVRHFRETLEHELERTRRSGQPTALIMVDLDHFKRINDTWGHEAGNKALIQTAAVLNLNTRKLDIPCRYGGEEFAVILPTTELLTARRVAERLRAAIEATAIPLETTTLRFTASLGLAIYTRHDRDSTEQFIACADQQLYRAKQDGRNRVCFAITPVEPEAAQVSMDEKELLSRLFSDAPDSDAPDS